MFPQQRGTAASAGWSGRLGEPAEIIMQDLEPSAGDHDADDAAPNRYSRGRGAGVVVELVTDEAAARCFWSRGSLRQDRCCSPR